MKKILLQGHPNENGFSCFPPNLRRFYVLIKAFYPLEALFIFLPYLQMRRLFPHTANAYKDTDPRFFKLSGQVAVGFFMWAKHVIGFFLNYVRFFDGITPFQQSHIFLISLFGSFSITVGVFLHTLKFKGYIGKFLSLFWKSAVPQGHCTDRFFGSN